MKFAPEGFLPHLSLALGLAAASTDFIVHQAILIGHPALEVYQNKNRFYQRLNAVACPDSDLIGTSNRGSFRNLKAA